jgi:uncharacterized protein YgiB involved in biofilm formation
MKRSAHINLLKMRKSFAVKPLTLAIATLMLGACGGGNQPAKIYSSAEECSAEFPERADECKAAFQQALGQAESAAPKFADKNTCETEFGANQCHAVQHQGGSSFMPFMMGYMLGNWSNRGAYYSQPLFTSSVFNSPYRDRWVGSDGTNYGDVRNRNVLVKGDAFKPKPAVASTIERGGFGSSVRAKSSWGSSGKSKGG